MDKLVSPQVSVTNAGLETGNGIFVSGG